MFCDKGQGAGDAGRALAGRAQARQLYRKATEEGSGVGC